MELLLSSLVGLLVFIGVLFLLQGTWMRTIIGMLLLSNAINLIIWVSAGISSREAPIIPKDGKVLHGMEIDPLPQALVLTAIVIAFALMSFFLVLAREIYRKRQSQEWADYKENS